MVEKRKHNINSDNEHIEESVGIDEPKKKRKQKETVVTHEGKNKSIYIILIIFCALINVNFSMLLHAEI